LKKHDRYSKGDGGAKLYRYRQYFHLDAVDLARQQDVKCSETKSK